MKYDAFSKYHPMTNFMFFVGAIGFTVVFQHPAYILAGCVFGGGYYLLLHGRSGLRMILGTLPMFILIAGLNPLLNTRGEHVLFHVFGKPYTLEALYYGMAVAGIFVGMMLWFGCYSAVMTSDKFTSLFGNLIPALSLLLVMALGMIPKLTRKAKQIMGARMGIGRGTSENQPAKEKIMDGMNVLSALTDWSLEGSIVTADSMRARGYGAAKRTSFQCYRMSATDVVLMILMAILCGVVIFTGGSSAAYTPKLSIEPIGSGFAAYCLFLVIPIVLHVKEAIQWHICVSRV